MARYVYFVRHGESEWNVQDRICGSTDIPLTDKGRRQAEETGRMLLAQGVKADVILYSPLSRAAETARIIASVTGIPLREEPRLTEQNFGRWEGTSPRNSPEFTLAKQQFVSCFDGGESMLHLAQRIYNLLDDVQASGQTCILAAHNGIARVVRSYFCDMTNEEYARFGVKNCELLKFELD